MRISCVLLAVVFVMAAARPASSCPQGRAQAPCCCGNVDDEVPEQPTIERGCCCVRGSSAPASAAGAPVVQSPVRPDLLPPAVITTAAVIVPAPARSLTQPPPAPRSLSPPTLVAMHALLLC